MSIFSKKKKEIELDENNIPRHVAVIMDGNGRWAKKRHLPRIMGHRAGVKTLEKITEYADKLGVKYITAYAFSTENWKRPQQEVDALMDLLYEYLDDSKNRLAGRNVRIKIVGDKSGLSEKIQKAIIKTEALTDKNTGITLNLAVNYGGRDEIINAVSKIARKVSEGKMIYKNIDEKMFGQFLYTHECPEVDLMIRPSGEMRISNFLLWQCAYAEFWFSNVNWPDFTEQDFRNAVLDYQKRDRRFGGTNLS